MSDERYDAGDPNEVRHRFSGIKRESEALAELVEAGKMSPHDSRRLQKLLAANTLALLANRDATLELAALVRASRDARADSIDNGARAET